MSRQNPRGRRKPSAKKTGGGARPGSAGPTRAAPAETPAADRPGGTRAARLEAARRARRRDAMRRWALVGVAVLVGVGALVVTLANAAADRREEQKVNDVLTAGRCTVDKRSDSGREHVERPTYEVDPPAGGDHLAQAANPGVYQPGQVPPDGQLVHAMEHGFVILWYRPGVSADTVADLERVAQEDAGATLVVPRASLDVPVAATAWHRRMLCRGGVEEKPLLEFIKAYRDKGPEKGFVQ